MGVAICVVTATVSKPAALLAALGVAGMTLFRGYILPGTPQLLSLARHIGDKTRKKQTESLSPLDRRDSGAAVSLRCQRELSPPEAERILSSADVIATDDSKLHLTEAFRNDWLDRIQTTREDDSCTTYLVTSISTSDRPDIQLSDQTDGGVGLILNGEVIGRWASRAALSADLTIIPILTEWVPDWESLNHSDRTTLIQTIRRVLDVCPSCGRQLVSARPEQGSDSANGHVSVTCDRCGPATMSRSSR